MATKPKSSENPPAQVAPLEKMLAQALELFSTGKLKEAAAAFETLLEQSAKTEEFRLGRTAQGYLKAISTRLEALEVNAPQVAELTAQFELNRKDPEAALALVEAGLKAHADHAGLHYLKALALAMQDEAQASAEALAKATSLDPGLIYQFRLDADFDGVRHTAPFAAFNRG